MNFKKKLVTVATMACLSFNNYAPLESKAKAQVEQLQLYTIYGSQEFILRSPDKEIRAYAINRERNMLPTIRITKPSTIRIRIYPLLREDEEEREKTIVYSINGQDIEIKGISRRSLLKSEILEGSPFEIGTPIDVAIEITEEMLEGGRTLQEHGIEVVLKKPNGFVEVVEVTERESGAVGTEEEQSPKRVEEPQQPNEESIENDEERAIEDNEESEISTLIRADLRTQQLLALYGNVGLGVAVNRTNLILAGEESRTNYGSWQLIVGPGIGVNEEDYMVMVVPAISIDFRSSNVTAEDRNRPQSETSIGAGLSFGARVGDWLFINAVTSTGTLPLYAAVELEKPIFTPIPASVLLEVALRRELKELNDGRIGSAEAILSPEGLLEVAVPIANIEWIPIPVLTASYPFDFGAGAMMRLIMLGHNVEFKVWYNTSGRHVNASIFIRSE